MRTLLKAILLTTLSISVSNFALADPTEDGMRALQAQNFSSAKSSFLRGASQGDVQSQVFLAMMYEKGLGVTQSDQRAAKWYCGAAKQGHKPSLEKVKVLAPRMSCTKHINTAQKSLEAKMYQYHSQQRETYRQAAELGGLKAQKQLAASYARGDGGLEVRNDLALKWYRKAADQGDKEAMAAVGSMYSHGQGVPASKEKAILWLKKAAAKGDAMSQMTLPTYGITEW